MAQMATMHSIETKNDYGNVEGESALPCPLAIATYYDEETGADPARHEVKGDEEKNGISWKWVNPLFATFLKVPFDPADIH